MTPCPAAQRAAVQQALDSGAFPRDCYVLSGLTTLAKLEETLRKGT